MIILQTFITFILLLILTSGASAQQILWKHKTSDVWLSADSSVDSSMAFTSISCFGNSCTAAAIVFDYPLNPIGRMTFYRTDNGGMSWVEQTPFLRVSPDIGNLGLTKIQQIDSLNAVAIGDEGVILKTSDGGKNWFRRDCPVKRELLSIHFSDPLTGVVLAVGYDSLILTTTDGGEHWINHPFYGDNYFSCHSYGNGAFSFYKYGRGPIFTTTDNFATIDSTKTIFDSVSDPKYRYIFNRVDFGKDSILIAHGSYIPTDTVGIFQTYGAIIRSVDFGKTWEKPFTYKALDLSRIKHLSSLDRDTIFGGGGESFHYIMSTDRGASWTLDSIHTDTTYEPWACLGIAFSGDSHPLAIWGTIGSPPILSILARGEYVKSKVEFIERIPYLTQIYPNPTSGVMNIESLVKGKSIRIIDIFGREMMDGILSDEGKLRLDLSILPRGVYSILMEAYGKVFAIGKVALIDN